MLKQEILNYEYEILSNHQIRKPELPASHQSHIFQQWNLTKIINQLQYNISTNYLDIRWIGNSSCSSVLAYFYCVFKVCAIHENMVVKLKYSMYQIAQYYLSLSQQKALIQFLSLLHQKLDLPLFFIKNRHIEKILIKLYDSHAGPKTQNPQYLLEFTKSLFDFVTIETLTEISTQIMAVSLRQPCSPKKQQSINQIRTSNAINTNNAIYIIHEKSCYFVCEQSQCCLPSKSVISSSKNYESQIIKEQEEGQNQSKIPSFLINKKQIRSDTKIINQPPIKHEANPSCHILSVNPSKSKVNEKIKQILQNSTSHPHLKNRYSLYYKPSKQSDKKYPHHSIKSPTNKSNNQHSVPKSSNKLRSINKSKTKQPTSPNHDANSYHKIDAQNLEIHLINKIHHPINIEEEINSARSQSKSLKKQLKYNQDALLNSSFEKDIISVFQNKKPKHNQQKYSNNIAVHQSLSSNISRCQLFNPVITSKQNPSSTTLTSNKKHYRLYGSPKHKPKISQQASNNK